MDYPKFIVSSQKEVSIGLLRAKYIARNGSGSLKQRNTNISPYLMIYLLPKYVYIESYSKKKAMQQFVL